MRHRLTAGLLFCFSLSWGKTAQELNKLLVRNNQQVCSAFFTPKHSITNLLIDLIDQERCSISMAIFYLTSAPLLKALLHARQQHGITIEIVLDSMCVSTRNIAQLNRMLQAGITILLYDKNKGYRGLMHNKYTIFGNVLTRKRQPLVATGSFNYTYSAQYKNRENIVLNNDKQLVRRYKQDFTDLKNNTVPLAQFLQGQPTRMKRVESQAVVAAIRNFFAYHDTAQ